MSIDARVKSVKFFESGGGELNLIDRPASPGGVPGIAGQKRLIFNSSPEEVSALNGLDVWGGSSEIMLGDVQIARRDGYTKIVFVDRVRFNAAVAAYHQRRAVQAAS